MVPPGFFMSGGFVTGGVTVLQCHSKIHFEDSSSTITKLRMKLRGNNEHSYVGNFVMST